MASSMTNQDIISQFRKAAAVLSVLNNNNFFRIRAYQAAVDTIQDLDEQLSDLIQQKDITKLPGIGEELGQKITELITHGRSADLEQLFSRVPQGMFPLLDIPGIGPKKAYQLAYTFKLNDPKQALATVKKLARQGGIGRLPGWGQISAQSLLDNLNRTRPKSARMRLDEADRLVTDIIAILGSIPEAKQVSVVGSVRRRKDTIGDIDLALATNHPGILSQKLKAHPHILGLKAAGPNLIRLNLIGNKQVDIKFQTPSKFGATLQHFTGSKSHNIALRELALSKKLSLSEHGIRSAGKLLPFATESKLYSALGLNYIPPEIRENNGEIKAAQKNNLPELVDLSHLKGDFHTHTDFPMDSSYDHGGPIPPILDFAQNHDYKWIALGDHNPSRSSYNSQQLVDQISKRQRYIQTQFRSWKGSAKKDLTVYSTLEVNILPDGSLALPPQALESLDIVIISIHSRFDLNFQDQTQRLLKALDHPQVKILGHPTCRIIPHRPPINADWDLIFKKCAVRHIALEINANPHRLDLPDNLIRKALDCSCKLAIGSDAHSLDQLSLISYGVDTARRGWARKSDILNSYSVSQLNTWLNK